MKERRHRLDYTENLGRVAHKIFIKHDINHMRLMGHP